MPLDIDITGEEWRQAVLAFTSARSPEEMGTHLTELQRILEYLPPDAMLSKMLCHQRDEALYAWAVDNWDG